MAIINWTIPVWKNLKHNAFTDLCEYAGQLYCCFREASNHVSSDGRIIIVKLDEKGHQKQIWRIQLNKVDLRDPKLVIDPQGKLILLAYGRRFDQNDAWLHSQPICWFSNDGASWSGEHWFGIKNWWLWRLTYHKNQAYGFAYNRRAQSIHLFKGDPLRSMHIHKHNVLGLDTHGLGYPNESDICFDVDGSATALVRRDADSFSAQLGISKPPYSHWQWHDLDDYIGAPAMLQWSKNTIIVAGRIYRKRKLKTAIWELNRQTKKLNLLLELPSSGDNSYPGLVRKNEDLFVSYYSSHEDNRSAIYLSKITNIE